MDIRAATHFEKLTLFLTSLQFARHLTTEKLIIHYYSHCFQGQSLLTDV